MPKSVVVLPPQRRCDVFWRHSSISGTKRPARSRPRSAFTLIELIVVIAIIATLAAVVAPALFQNVADAKTSAAKSQIEMLALALNAYRLDNDAFPTSAQGLEALRTMPAS